MDKTAEEILDNIPIPMIGKRALVFTYTEAIKAMQAYHEAKMKEELIKYDKWLVSHKWGETIHTPEKCADEYIKQRNNDSKRIFV